MFIMITMIKVLRLFHRAHRDHRVTTHCALVSRAFGADEFVFSGERDTSIILSVNDVVRRWGGPFNISYVPSWRSWLSKQKAKREAKKNDLVISTYALAYRDQETFSAVHWENIGLDEAQNIKNPSAKQTQAIRKLKANGVDIRTGSKLLRVEDGGVVVTTPEGGQTFVEASRVVTAIGSVPDDTLYDGIRSLGFEVYKIGDCKEPRSAKAAIYESGVLGRSI